MNTTIELTKGNGHKVMMSIESMNAWLLKNYKFEIVTCIYTDGYNTMSQKAVISEGMPIKSSDGFGLALKAVKVGKRIA